VDTAVLRNSNLQAANGVKIPDRL